MTTNTHVVTIAPPTPNGDLHLGHLAGPFLAADVYTRSLRQRGHDVRLLCYTDDYQSYAARKAHERGVSVAASTRENGDKIERSLQHAQVQVDALARAWENPHYLRATADLHRRAWSRGAMRKVQKVVPFCRDCDRWGYEAFARTKCNFCGHPSDLSQCEYCARRPLAAAGLRATCTLCGAATQARASTVEQLDLRPLRHLLVEESRAVQLRPRLREFLDEILDDDQQLLWDVTRPGEHGVPIVSNGRRELVSTWFAGLGGYQAAYLECTGNTSLRAWDDEVGSVTHFLGFDCVFSHAVVYRALAWLGEHVPPPLYVYPNEFLTLEGKDFSTSRGHAIWIADAVQRFDADTLRMYLASISPEQEREDFRLAAYEVARDKLLDEHRRLHQNLTLGVSALEGPSAIATRAVLPWIERWRDMTAPGQYSLRGLASLANIARELAVAAIGTRHATWLAAAYAVVAEPLQPTSSAELLRACGLAPSRVRAWLLHGVGRPSTIDAAMESGAASVAASLPVA